MKAATHNGNCQVCGRLQALPKGRLSLHGYQVAGFGFFNGVCSGARALPLQQERTIADRIIVQLGEYASREEQAAADLKAGVTVPVRAKSGKRVQEKVVRDGRERLAWVDVYVDYADAPEWEQRSALQSAIYKHETEARQARSHARSLRQLADKVHGTALIPVEPEAGANVAQAGTKVTVYGDTLVELVEQCWIQPRGWSRNAQRGWKVKRVDDGKTFEIANATITRALKKA